MMMTRGKRILFGLLLIAVALLIFLLLSTGVDFWLQRNLILYSKTPPILMTVLFVVAAFGVYRNDTDRGRLFVVASLLGIAACYAIQQWQPAWWPLYGASLFRIALFWHGLSIFALSRFRRLRRGA